jgi:hypothetical protein
VTLPPQAGGDLARGGDARGAMSVESARELHHRQAVRVLRQDLERAQASIQRVRMGRGSWRGLIGAGNDKLREERGLHGSP